VLAATPLYVVSAAYMDGVIRLLTGVNARPARCSGRAVAVRWYYSLTLTHWVFKRMFLMAGQERRMMWQGVAKPPANLAAQHQPHLLPSEASSASPSASVIPTVLFGWGLLWGWAAKEAAMSRWALFRRVVLPAWLGCLPMVGVALALRFQPWWPSGSNTLLVLTEGAVVGAAGLLGIWSLSLSPAERSQLSTRFRRRRSPTAAANS
jgi:hypothetical protein